MPFGAENSVYMGIFTIEWFVILKRDVLVIIDDTFIQTIQNMLFL